MLCSCSGILHGAKAHCGNHSRCSRTIVQQGQTSECHAFEQADEGNASQIFKTLTVSAEIITELILKRAGPVIFKTFLLELIAFRPIPVICPAR